MSAPALRVGVVGAGGIAHSHLAAWQHLRVPVAVHSDVGAPQIGAEYDVPVVATLEELLAGCDVVDVCTPTDVHERIVLAAAAAGRHVICEKPLSLHRAEAAGMIAACAAAGVQLHPGQVVRYFPAYAAARAAVRAGRVGTPAVLRLSRRGARPRQPWFGDPTRSGGIIVDQMIHDLDFARWVAGPVEAVYARVVDAAPAPTLAVAVLTHSGGALTQVTGGWGLASEPFRTSLSIAGDAGLLRHSSADTEPLRWSLPGIGPAGGELVPGGAVQSSPFVTELAEFLGACAGGAAPRVSAQDSLAALDIALAATRSAATGDQVRVEAVAGIAVDAAVDMDVNVDVDVTQRAEAGADAHTAQVGACG